MFWRNFHWKYESLFTLASSPEWNQSASTRYGPVFIQETAQDLPLQFCKLVVSLAGKESRYFMDTTLSSTSSGTPRTFLLGTHLTRWTRKNFWMMMTTFSWQMMAR